MEYSASQGRLLKTTQLRTSSVAVCLKCLVKSKAMFSLCMSDVNSLSRNRCVAGIMYSQCLKIELTIFCIYSLLNLFFNYVLIETHSNTTCSQLRRFQHPAVRTVSLAKPNTPSLLSVMDCFSLAQTRIARVYYK